MATDTSKLRTQVGDGPHESRSAMTLYFAACLRKLLGVNEHGHPLRPGSDGLLLRPIEIGDRLGGCLSKRSCRVRAPHRDLLGDRHRRKAARRQRPRSTHLPALYQRDGPTAGTSVHGDCGIRATDDDCSSISKRPAGPTSTGRPGYQIRSYMTCIVGRLRRRR